MNPFERWDDWEWEKAAQEIGRGDPYSPRDFQRSRSSSYEKASSKDFLEILNGSQKRVMLSGLLFLTIVFSARGEDAVSQGVYSFYKNGLDSGNLYTSLNTMAKEAMGISGTDSMPVNMQVQGIFYPPVAGPLKVGFGGENSEGLLSQGIEIESTLGSPVLCPEEGVVLEVSENERLGRFIRINFGNGWEGIIGNLGEVTVSRGDPVSMGLKVGTVGIKAASQKPWIYLALIKDGNPMNPLQYLIQNK